MLLDMDPRGNFDPMQLSLPNGTRLVPLFGLSRPQTLDLYQRAKVGCQACILCPQEAWLKPKVCSTACF